MDSCSMDHFLCCRQAAARMRYRPHGNCSRVADDQAVLACICGTICTLKWRDSSVRDFPLKERPQPRTSRKSIVANSETKYQPSELFLNGWSHTTSGISESDPDGNFPQKCGEFPQKRDFAEIGQLNFALPVSPFWCSIRRSNCGNWDSEILNRLPHKM